MNDESHLFHIKMNIIKIDEHCIIVVTKNMTFSYLFQNVSFGMILYGMCICVSVCICVFAGLRKIRLKNINIIYNKYFYYFQVIFIVRFKMIIAIRITFIKSFTLFFFVIYKLTIIIFN